MRSVISTSDWKRSSASDVCEDDRIFLIAQNFSRPGSPYTAR